MRNGGSPLAFRSDYQSHLIFKLSISHIYWYYLIFIHHHLWKRKVRSPPPRRYRTTASSLPFERGSLLLTSLNVFRDIQKVKGALFRASFWSDESRIIACWLMSQRTKANALLDFRWLRSPWKLSHSRIGPFSVTSNPQVCLKYGRQPEGSS